jgi:peptide/nickel transport system permease protein
MTTADAFAVDPAALPQQSEASIRRRELVRQLGRSTTFWVGVFIIGWWVFWAIAGSGLTPQDPSVQSADILKPPSTAHLLGTDQLGRDVLSRVLAGAADTLLIAPVAALLGVIGGTIVGLICGFFRGFADESISRFIDAILALPLIVIAVTAIAAVGHSKATLILVIGAIFTPIVARTVRAAVLAERQLEYVSAARARAEPAPYIMFVEILPNVMSTIIVELTVRVGYAVFAVAGLTFLGFGVQPPAPDWSLQITENYSLLTSGSYWWTVLFPALAVATLVVGVNLISDALQQVFDRESSTRRRRPRGLPTRQPAGVRVT